jgi:aspartyl-tRNA(Asn)/glutamyl-tRNA(Gln) amidotransferase subunit B
MHSPHEAMEFIRALRTQIRYIGTAECSMEAGTMRVDANISLRPKGTDQLNTKVEVKNMNSIRHMGDAIAYEISRQTESLRTGEPIVLHTRLWDPDKRITVAMRGKFEGPCIPDPAVPHIVITEAWKNMMAANLPEMPGVKAERFVHQYSLTREEALMISAERDLSEYFEAVVRKKVSPRTAAHWVAAQFLPALKDRNQTFADTPVTAERFADLLFLLEKNEINAKAAREVMEHLFTGDQTPAEIIDQQGFRQLSDAGQIEGIVNDVLAANASAVTDYRNGVGKAMGFLMGQAMQATKGKGNPKLIKDILEKKLSA